MHSLIISLFLIFSCNNTVLALSNNDANKFGDNFITAIQAGESINFIPNQFHLETFLYSAFGQDYLKLTSEEKKQAQTSLANSLKI